MSQRVLPNTNIGDIKIIKENSIEEGFLNRSVRLDIYAEDNNYLFDIEMENKSDKADLLKRSIYYSGIMDISDLEKSQDYSKLKNSFVIFFCDFDPFDDNIYVYTISHHCKENGKYIDSGKISIFINLRGKSGNITKELKNLIIYMRTGKIIEEDDFIKDIDEEVKKNRNNPKWRREEMSLEAKLVSSRNYGYKQGEASGLKKGEKKGLEKGMEKGMKKGMKKGKEEGLELGMVYSYEELKEEEGEKAIEKVAKIFKTTTKEVKRILKAHHCL